MTIAEMLKAARENRAAALNTVKALGEKIENRTWAEDTDGPALDAAKKTLDAAEKEVLRLEDMLTIEARSAGWTADTTAATGVNVNVLPTGRTGDRQERAKQEYSFLRVMRSVMGGQSLDGLEKEMHEEGVKEMRESGVSGYGRGIMVPSLLQTRDLSAGTTTEGGFTIQTDIGRLIPYLEPMPVIARMGATMLNGLVGNIDFPRNDGNSTAVWEAEQATADETSATFDRVQMTPNRLAAWTDFSMQFVRQTTISAENFVRRSLMDARDRALDLAALNGSGSSQPTGITGTSGVNVITVAASPTWAKIVDFETQVSADNAAFGRLAYLTTPTIAGILKGVKRDVAGNGFIWEGPNNGSGTINGYNAFVSNTVPTSGGAHYMFFGNWQKLLVGQWGAMEITADPYTRLTEATVRLVLNTWHDIAVEHGGAFSYSSSVHPS